jgi:hypothetical protein
MDRVYEHQHRFATRSKVGETGRAYRIEPEEASPIQRDPSDAADESQVAARRLRRRKRARHRRDRLGEYGTKMDLRNPGMPFYFLVAETAVAWKAQDPRGSAVRWTFEV